MSTAAAPTDPVELRGDLFEGLSSGELGALSEIASPIHLPAGQPIFNLGESARRVFYIASGKVSVTLPVVLRGTSKEITVDEKEAGAIIGWSALVPPYKFTLSGRAATDVILVGLDRVALTALFEKDPELRCKMISNLNRVIASRVRLLEGLFARSLQRWAAGQ